MSRLGPSEDLEKVDRHQPPLNNVPQPDNNGADRRTGSHDEKTFEVAWDGPKDPMNPQSMAKARKWLITMTIASSSFCVTANSSLYTTTYDQLIPRFNTSREVATLGLSTFVWGLMIGCVTERRKTQS
ncbi:MAG: hypothetical protein M1828_003950 [Chrysothrix sp. TS-e1954]|nr:MAG: hypothetical protein M1828_003950 [Chrysothrix sp. TS-e1954]